MKKIIAFIFLIYIGLCANAQSFFCKTYTNTSMDYAQSAKQTPDGGYIISGATDYKALLIKTAANGDTLWTKTYGNSLQNNFNDVQLSLDGGYVMVGTQKTNTVIINTNDEDVYFVKTNANGDTLWRKYIGGPYIDQGHAVIPLADSTYIISGQTQAPGSGYGSNYLIKTDKNGNILWQKTHIAFGSIGYLSAIDTTSGGGFIITDSKQDTVTGYLDFLLIKTNSLGDTLWTKTFDNTLYDISYSVKQTPDGGYILCGNSWNNDYDAYIIKTDALGNTQWTKTMGNINDEDLLRTVQVNSDQDYVFSGSSNNNVSIVKLNSSGTTLWNKLYVTPIYHNGYYIGETFNKGYFIAGYALDSTNMTPGDVFLLRTDSLAVGFSNKLMTVGIKESNLSNDLNVFPNPFSLSTTLQTIVFLNNAVLTIYNSYGQLVKKIDKLSGHTINLQRDNLSSGLYFFNLTQDNKIISTNKLIVVDN